MTGKANRLPYFFLGGPDCRYSVMIGTAGAGGGPLRPESARRLTPEIRQSKFPGTPRPSVTLALAAPGPPVQLRWTTLRVQGPTLRDAALANGGDGSPPVARGLLPQPPSTARFPQRCEPHGGGRGRGPREMVVSFRGVAAGSLERSCAVGNLVAGRELEHRYGQAADRELEACV